MDDIDHYWLADWLAGFSSAYPHRLMFEPTRSRARAVQHKFIDIILHISVFYLKLVERTTDRPSDHRNSWSYNIVQGAVHIVYGSVALASFVKREEVWKMDFSTQLLCFVCCLCSGLGWNPDYTRDPPAKG